MDAFRVCHADDAPRLNGHLPEVGADELWIIMADQAVAEVACECGLLPVLTPAGWCGITPVHWGLYLALCAVGRMDMESEVAA